MKRITFRVEIKADKKKVWETLWNDRSYRMWTNVFSEGSCMKADWKEGGRVLFVNETGNGMFSVIDKLTPNEYVAFKHLGEFTDGKEVPANDKSREWAGSIECYTLSELGGITSLLVELDTNEELASYFEKQFPIALAKVKELAEK